MNVVTECLCPCKPGTRHAYDCRCRLGCKCNDDHTVDFEIQNTPPYGTQQWGTLPLEEDEDE